MEKINVKRLKMVVQRENGDNLCEKIVVGEGILGRNSYFGYADVSATLNFCVRADLTLTIGNSYPNVLDADGHLVFLLQLRVCFFFFW